MNHAEKLLFTWNSMFGNNYFGETDDLLRHQGNRRPHRVGPGSLPAQGRRTRPNRQSTAGDMDRTEHAHAELLRLRAQPQRDRTAPFELGFRTRHYLPDGHRFVSAAGHRAAGIPRPKISHNVLQTQLTWRKSAGKGTSHEDQDESTLDTRRTDNPTQLSGRRRAGRSRHFHRAAARAGGRRKTVGQ